MNELISIIVPVYKVEHYLEACLNSITGQTYKNLEIILVDDGSPDNCGTICDEFAQKDSRIKVIHQENRGLSEARNSGMDIMTGSFFAFVDSDDIISPLFFEILYSILKRNNTDISMCEIAYNEDDIYNLHNINECNKIKTMSEYEYAHQLLNHYTTPYSVVWNKLYRTDKYGNLRFYNGVLFEDNRFLADYLLIGATCTKTDSKLYYYRKRENSLTFRKDMNYIIGSINASKYQYDLLKKRYDNGFRLKFYTGLLNRISRLAADVYWNLDKSESDKLYSIWLQFYNSDKQAISNIKENVKIHLYKHFPILYYHLVKKSIYSIIDVS